MRLEPCACIPPNQPTVAAAWQTHVGGSSTGEGAGACKGRTSCTLELVENDGSAQEVPLIGDLDAAVLPRALHVLPLDGLRSRLLPPQQRLPVAHAAQGHRQQPTVPVPVQGC